MLFNIYLKVLSLLEIEFESPFFIYLFSKIKDPIEKTRIIIEMPIYDTYSYLKTFLGKSMPQEIYEKAMKFHSDPFAWWTGQLFSYMMRYNADFEQIVNEASMKIQFDSSCVG